MDGSGVFLIALATQFTEDTALASVFCLETILLIFSCDQRSAAQFWPPVVLQFIQALFRGGEKSKRDKDMGKRTGSFFGGGGVIVGGDLPHSTRN